MGNEIGNLVRLGRGYYYYGGACIICRACLLTVLRWVRSSAEATPGVEKMGMGKGKILDDLTGWGQGSDTKL